MPVSIPERTSRFAAGLLRRDADVAQLLVRQLEQISPLAPAIGEAAKASYEIRERDDGEPTAAQAANVTLSRRTNCLYCTHCDTAFFQLSRTTPRGLYALTD
jgi:hypothetical protein